jgi:hypothetical protein
MRPNLKPKNPLLEGALKAEKNLINKGVIVDPEILKEKAGTPSTEYEGYERNFDNLEKDYYDKFEDYIDPTSLRGRSMSLDEMKQMRFDNQATSEQLGNFAKRVATNIVPQIVSGFSSMLDVQGYWDAEHAANNEIVKWANDLQNSTNEDYAIYTDPKGDTMDLGSMSWWLDRGSGLVTSVGAFLAQGWGVGKLASLGIKGASYALQGKNLLNTVLGASRVQKGVNALGQLSTAVALNQSEAVIEATQVYQSTYDNALKSNLSVEEAKKRAANAAATTMNINRANILLNLSSASMFVNPSTALTRGLLEAPEGILHKVLKEGSQEALEELNNLVAQKSGEAVGRGEHKRGNILDDYQIASKHIKDVVSMEGLEAAFLGAIGGIAQTGGTEALRSTTFGPGAVTDKVTGEKMSARTAERVNYEKQQEVIKQMKDQGINITGLVQDLKDQMTFFDEIQQAHAKGDTAKVEELKDQLFVNKALKAFQSGTTEVLEDMIKAEASKPVEEVGQEHIDKAKSALGDLKVLERTYNDFSNYANVNDVFMNRVDKLHTDKAYQSVDTLHKEASVQLGEQVRTIASKYNFKQDKGFTNKENGEVVSTGTREVEVPLMYSMGNLENNQGDTEYNKEQYEKFLAEVKSLPAYNNTQRYETELNGLAQRKVEIDKDFDYLKSPKAQEEAQKAKEEKEGLEQAHKDLDAATTISQVDALASKFNDKGFQAKVADKKKKIQDGIAATAKQKKVDLAVQQLYNKIDSVTEDTADALREEIIQAEFDKKYKDALTNALENKLSNLNGNTEEFEDPLSQLGFTQGNEEENKASVEANNKTLETNLPKDLPNPSTEATDVEAEIENAVQSALQNDKTNVVGQDTNGNLIYNYDKSSEGYNRAAHLSREFEQVDENGEVTRNENTNEITGNKELLNPDSFQPGTELSMEIDTEYSGDKLDPTSTTRETQSWDTRLLQLQAKADAQGIPLATLPEYIEEVPIKVTDADGNIVFYVHDNSWYQEENLDNTPENIALDKARNFEIRKSIIEKGVVKSKVEYKSIGKLFKTADNKPISVSEAMPDENLIIAVGKNSTYELSGSHSTLLGKDGKILSKNTPKDGRAYAIVKVAPNTYLPIALQRNPISQEIQDSIYYAIEAHLSKDVENPVVKEIINKMNIDITTPTGLAKYINQFIYLFPTNKSEGLESTFIQGGINSSLKSNNPLIAVTPTGIEFGRPGIQMGTTTVGGQKVQKFTVTISQNFKDNTKNLAKLKTILPNLLSNVTINDLKLNKNTVLILDADGATKTQTYLETVKQSHSTNVLSVNVGTDENPKYAYTIQPTILFDTKFAKLEKVNSKQAKKSTPKKSTTQSEIEAKKTDIEKAQKQLDGVESKINPNAKHPLFNVGDKHNEDNKYIVESILDKRTNVKTEGVEVITRIISPAEVDTNGKMTKAAKVEITLFDSYEQAQEFINTQYNKYRTIAEERLTKVKKAAIEKRRQEELNSELDKKAKDIPVKREYYNTIQGGQVEITTYRDGSKIVRGVESGNQIAEFKPSEKIEESYDGVIEDFTPYKTEEVESKLAKKINAKYNAELAAVEQPTTQQQIAKQEVERLRAEEQKENAVIEARKQKELDSVDILKEGKIPIEGYEEFYKNVNDKYEKELADVYDKYDKLITPLLEQTSNQPIAENNNSIDAHANELLEQGFSSLEELESLRDGIQDVVNNVDLGLVSEEEILKSNPSFNSVEEILESVERAVELYKERSQEVVKKITLATGQTLEITKADVDSKPISEDEEDFALPKLEEKQIQSINDEVESNFIRGLNTESQNALIAYIASDIMMETVKAKEKDGTKSVNTKPIFDKHLKSLEQTAKAFRDAGFPNKADRVDAIIEQFNKVNVLVHQKMGALTTGKIDTDLELTETEEAGGLEKTIYTDDWSFTINSKSTASVDLKKFFSSIQAQDKNGAVTHALGFPIIIPFDVVYDTLHELLANKPADYKLMITTLELQSENIPWLKSVVDLLENSSEKIQNEFVSDMTKHHIDMQFVMWSKDKNGNYSLQKWSSNASSTEQRLRAVWNSNLKGSVSKSNLVEVDANDEYVFNQELAKILINQAEEFKKDPNAVTFDELANWLGQFGIVLTDNTYKDLKEGKYNNNGRKQWSELFTNSAGLVNVLAKSLKNNLSVSVEKAEILNDTAIKALAKLDAQHNLNIFSNSFQAGGKTIYSYGNNNYLVNRMRDLTSYDAENKVFTNQELIDNLKSISFTRDSLWLNELTNEGEEGEYFRSVLNLGYLSLEALKKKFTLSQDNRKLNNLVTAEHEVTKLGLFFNRSGKVVGNEQRRVVNFFYPTMSDKTTMLTIQALTREVNLEEGKISKNNIKVLYDAIVTPEINRIVDKQATTVKGYEPNYFYFFPSLNTLTITIDDVEKNFRDLVLDKDDRIYTDEIRSQVEEELASVFENLLNKKLEDWKQLGIGETLKNSNGKVIDNNTFLDKEYMSHVAKVGEGVDKVKYAAMDYVYNTLIANSEMYKLFAGDPAMYAKFKPNNTIQQNLEDTFINLGKRLAGDIAPGIELANSDKNVYYQVFLKDKKIDSNNVKDSIQKEFFNKIVSDYSKNYSGIEGSDAQEYTTWQEHLFVLKQLGRITSKQFDTFTRKLTSQSNSGVTNNNKLSYEELDLVLQPIKPVYVGNIASAEDNLDRRVYIKSSSFPLIPELTVGLQIDKIRQSLEKFEDSKKEATGPDGQRIFVRASFDTANKVGATNNSIDVFDDNGNVIDNLNVSDDNTLLLKRSNFRIQQDVPYQRDKDSVNSGSQERKLLFVNTLDVEIEPGVTGQDLLVEYHKAYENLFKYGQEKLAERLGLTEKVDVQLDLATLTTIPTTNTVELIATKTEEISKIKNPIAKAKAQEELAVTIGEDNLDRINYINANFDKIVEALAESKINVFFDENEQFKKCE